MFSEHRRDPLLNQYDTAEWTRHGRPRRPRYPGTDVANAPVRQSSRVRARGGCAGPDRLHARVLTRRRGAGVVLGGAGIRGVEDATAPDVRPGRRRAAVARPLPP